MVKKKKQEEGRRKEKIKVWKNQTINPFFFYEFGLKESYLVYWWCLAVLDYIWSCFGLVLWLIWGCMETKYVFPKFLRLRKLS